MLCRLMWFPDLQASVREVSGSVLHDTKLAINPLSEPSRARKESTHEGGNLSQDFIVCELLLWLEVGRHVRLD